MERNRRAALEGLQRILDAGGLEELFAGPDDDAAFLYDLLAEAARGSRSTIYWEICRTARRRGLTPEFVADRAAVLRVAMEERRRTDLYRILGAPPLSSPDMLRQRWLDFVKGNHPDVGGDAGQFRRVKEAWNVLRDPERRSEYERFWLRALGPFERVAPPEEAPPRLERRPTLVDGRPGVARADAGVTVVRAAVGPGPGEPAPAPSTSGEPVGLGLLRDRIDAMLTSVTVAEIERLRSDVDAAIVTLETVRTHLVQLTALKHALPA